MVYTIMKYLSTPLLSPFIGEIDFRENLPKKRAVFCANHASYLDHFLIGGLVARRIESDLHYLAKKEHFDSYLSRKWHEGLKAIPMNRKAGGKEALVSALKALEEGRCIMMYPEGTRTLTGKINQAKLGAARLILTAKVPVVPIGLTNTFDILPKGRTIPRFGKKTDIRVGDAMFFDEYYGREGEKETLRVVTNAIMKEIAKLSKQNYDYD
jgi:1-acyl-sn-glycerol-3-phosphate acyltransferase